jgi:hypothetical protein
MEKVAALMASGSGVKEAAETAGVSRQKVWRWEKEDDEDGRTFRALVAQAQERVGQAVAQDGVAQALVRLRGLAPKIVDVFEAGLSPTVDLKLRLRAGDLAARRIPEMAPQSKVEHSGTLEARIREYHADGPQPSD